jgi:ABC-type transport system involved in multi-copper enzyme maturation permease subunit
MIDRLLAIAGNTFRETNRNRVMYVLLLFAVMLILFSVTMGKLALHEEVRLIKDIGLAAMSLFGVVIAAYLGVTVAHRELDQKTVYFVIPKPVGRTEFLVGKLLGTMITLVIQVAIMTSVFLGVLALYGGTPTPSLAKAILLVFCETILVLCVANFLASLTGPILAGFLCLAIFVLGRATPFIQQISVVRGEWRAIDYLLAAAYYLLPDFNLFAVSGAVELQRTVHDVFFTWSYVAYAAGYAALYGTVMMVFTVLRFRRKDLV